MIRGLQRVAATFNPSGSPAVSAIKSQAAGLIALIETIPAEGDQAAEIARLKAVAQERIEEAVMWAVKAATR